MRFGKSLRNATSLRKRNETKQTNKQKKRLKAIRLGRRVDVSPISRFIFHLPPPLAVAFGSLLSCLVSDLSAGTKHT
jgi:hypothetical protein